MLKQYLKRIIKEVLEKDGIESLKIGKHTAYVRNDKVHVSAATPKIQLQGTEISAMNLSLRENAGAIELYDETAAVVRASWSGTTGRKITPLIADTEIASNAVTESKIADSAVTNTKIANNAITAAKINTNILRGIVPVASGWGTDPTNLANATDGDVDTVTGTGSKVLDAAGMYGYITFDLGAIKTALIGCRLGTWSTASTVYVYADESDDNITWRTSPNPLINMSSVAENVASGTARIVTGRYLRIRFYVGGAATCYAKIYEVMAWELQI